jgi:hypothetical protein
VRGNSLLVAEPLKHLVEPEVDEGVAGDVGHGQDVAHKEQGGGVTRWTTRFAANIRKS